MTIIFIIAHGCYKFGPTFIIKNNFSLHFSTPINECVESNFTSVELDINKYKNIIKNGRSYEYMLNFTENDIENNNFNSFGVYLLKGNNISIEEKELGYRNRKNIKLSDIISDLEEKYNDHIYIYCQVCRTRCLD
jgi:hypothetical protein